MRTKPAIVGSGAALGAFAAVTLALSNSYELRHVQSGVAQAATAAPVVVTDASTTSLQNLYVNISDKMMPSVVNIFTTKKVRAMPRRMFPGGQGIPEDFWNNFFGGMMVPQGPQGRGGPDEDDGPEAQAFRPSAGQPASQPYALGTGFVVEAESKGGLILTNNHVIAGADEVKVKFTENDDENEVPAQVIGRDPELDVALLRVKTERKLTPLVLGDSDRLKVGEWVAAAGNPFGHGHSITHGIVSAKERALPGGFGKYLQVDAPINPGNSGGPLVNLNAEVVGINNAIDARGPGIGFAIPINSVKAVLEQLKSGHQVERGYLGVNIMPIKPELARALRADVAAGTPVVAEVMPGTPAAKAGIEPYDVITQIDGHKVKSAEELMQAIMQIPVGNRVKAEIWRSGKQITLDIPVSKRPDPRSA